jgi:hypothetical protein
MSTVLGLPVDVYFGDADSEPPDWRSVDTDIDDDPDDELLAETPADVVAMLGFDPLEMLSNREQETSVRGLQTKTSENKHDS